jgi:hypothetical protein
VQRARQGWVVFVLVLAAHGQGFSGGLKIGVPITQYFETGATGSRNGNAEYSAATRRYTFGASAEWRFTRSLGIEVEALFHRMGYVGIVNFTSSASGDIDNTAIDVKGDSWDFPLLAKYRFRSRVARPYIAGGGVLRYVGPVHGVGRQTIGSLVTQTGTTTPIDTSDPSELRKRTYPGVAVGGGIEIGAGRIRVLPEFRYTRWTANIGGPGSLLRFANQAEFLLGILF